MNHIKKGMYVYFNLILEKYILFVNCIELGIEVYLYPYMKKYVLSVLIIMS